MFSHRIKKLVSPLLAIGKSYSTLTRQVQETAHKTEQLKARIERVLVLVEENNKTKNKNKSSKHNISIDSDFEKSRQDNYYDALRSVGVLNYQNSVVSGEYHFLRNLLTEFPDAVVLDVGANAGHYAALVRSFSAQAEIHAFEPHPAAFAKLKAAADDGNFFAYDLALGDADGEIELFDYVAEGGSEHASVYRDVIEIGHKRQSASLKVCSKTLDTAAGILGINKITFLKIDVEGHELSVLHGASRLLNSHAIDVIQFEFNEMNVYSRVFMRDFFNVLKNYRIYRILSDGVIEFEVYDPVFMEVFAYQNIVCVRRDINPYWVHRAP